MKVVPIHNEIRVNLTITDKQGLAIRLNERGPKITPEELTRVEKVGGEPAGNGLVADVVREHSAGGVHRFLHQADRTGARTQSEDACWIPMAMRCCTASKRDRPS